MSKTRRYKRAIQKVEHYQKKIDAIQDEIVKMRLIEDYHPPLRGDIVIYREQYHQKELKYWVVRLEDMKRGENRRLKKKNERY